MERQIELQILKTRRMQYLKGILLGLGMTLILIGTAFTVDNYMNTPENKGDLTTEPTLPTLPSDDGQIPSNNWTGNKTKNDNDNQTDNPLDRVSLLAAQIQKNYETAVYMRVNFNYTIIINETDFGGWNKDIHLTRINSSSWSAYVWFANFSGGYPDDLRISNYTASYADSDIQQINWLITDGVNETGEVDWDWSSFDPLAGGGNFGYSFDIYYENGTGIELRIDSNLLGEGVVVYIEFLWDALVSYSWGEFPLPVIPYPFDPLYLSPITAFDNAVAKVHELFSNTRSG